MSAERIVERLLTESPAPVEAPPRPGTRPDTAPPARPTAPPPTRRPWKAPPFIRPGHEPRPKARHPYRYDDDQVFAESAVKNQIAGWLRKSDAVFEDWTWDNVANKLIVTLLDGKKEVYTGKTLAAMGVLTEKHKSHKDGCNCWFCKKTSGAGDAAKAEKKEEPKEEGDSVDGGDVDVTESCGPKGKDPCKGKAANLLANIDVIGAPNRNKRKNFKR